MPNIRKTTPHPLGGLLLKTKQNKKSVGEDVEKLEHLAASGSGKECGYNRRWYGDSPVN